MWKETKVEDGFVHPRRNSNNRRNKRKDDADDNENAIDHDLLHNHFPNNECHIQRNKKDPRGCCVHSKMCEETLCSTTRCASIHRSDGIDTVPVIDIASFHETPTGRKGERPRHEHHDDRKSLRILATIGFLQVEKTNHNRRDGIHISQSRKHVHDNILCIVRKHGDGTHERTFTCIRILSKRFNATLLSWWTRRHRNTGRIIQAGARKQEGGVTRITGWKYPASLRKER
mmetsp:Transcript_14191/g.36252  ORF Transcript_14191/g.36252 Transcript_14191/m.36252 type:complete len:230 (+) Transcript_14191:677-1366(+)